MKIYNIFDPQNSKANINGIDTKNLKIYITKLQ